MVERLQPLVMDSYPTSRQKILWITTPSNPGWNIFMFVETCKRNIRSPDVPHIDARIDNQSTTRYVILSLWAPFDSADTCYCVNCVLACWFRQHIPDLKVTIQFNHYLSSQELMYYKKKNDLYRFVSTGCCKPTCFRMPVTSKNWSAVCSEMLKIFIRSSYIPLLYLSCFGYCSKSMWLVGTKLNVSNGFSVTAKVIRIQIDSFYFICFITTMCSGIPKKCFDSFFDSEIKTFHCSILRSWDKPHRFCHVKTYFVDSSGVIHKHMFLFWSRGSVQVPNNDCSICCCSC